MFNLVDAHQDGGKSGQQTLPPPQYYESGRHSPYYDAVAGRALYFGLRGKLLPDMSDIKAAIGRSGPIGEATLARMDAMAASGYTFGPQAFNDAYMLKNYPNAFKRAMAMINVNGYRNGEVGRIAYNQTGAVLKTLLGVESGADRSVASVFMHEVAHGQYDPGYLAYEHGPFARQQFMTLPDVPPASAQGINTASTIPLSKFEHGAEMLREEQRAITSQVLGTSRLSDEGLARFFPQARGLGGISSEVMARTDNLGPFIKANWRYVGTGFLTSEQASQISRDYARTTYGDLFVNGKVNPEAEAAVAAQIRALPVEPPAGLRNLAGETLGAPGEFNNLSGRYAGNSAESGEAASAMSRFFSDPANRRFLMRGAQGVGALGIAFTIADLNGAFHSSIGNGIGMAGRMGANWAAFEGGMGLGAGIGEKVAMLAAERLPGAAPLMPIAFGIFSGIVTSQISDMTIGNRLQHKLQQEIDDNI
jgi:hypothetical protein